MVAFDQPAAWSKCELALTCWRPIALSFLGFPPFSSIVNTPVYVAGAQHTRVDDWPADATWEMSKVLLVLADMHILPPALHKIVEGVWKL